jgi:hypothetical protein
MTALVEKEVLDITTKEETHVASGREAGSLCTDTTATACPLGSPSLVDHSFGTGVSSAVIRERF